MRNQKRSLESLKKSGITTLQPEQQQQLRGGGDTLIIIVVEAVDTETIIIVH